MDVSAQVGQEVDGPDRIFATLLAEVGFQRRLSVGKNRPALDPRRKEQAFGLRVIFTPSYFQVLPNLDLTLPITVTYNPEGRAPLSAFNGGAHNGGVASVGVGAEYRRVWIANLQGSFFFGREDFQPRRDRHFVSLAIARTF